MRRILLILSCLYVVGCVGRRTTGISGTVAEHLNVSGQWCYWYIDYDGQSDIIDSCIIENNRFKLSAKLPGEEVMSQILISGLKRNYYFISTDQEHATMQIDSTTLLFMPFIEGSPTTRKMRQQLDKLGYLHRDKIMIMQDSMMCVPADSEMSRLWKDSVLFYTHEREAYCRDIILNSSSALCAISIFMTGDMQHIDADSLQKTRQYIMTHYPNSGYLFLIDPDYTPTFNTHTIWAENRRAQILGATLPYPDWKYETPPASVADNDDIATYKKDDVVSDIRFANAGGNELSLAAIHTDYILIDFWASWCRPCRREVPFIKTVHQKYGDILSVVAISIDEDREEWLRAIEDDNSSDLIHLLLNAKEPEYKKIMQQFNVKTIPHNFLLDKDRRIIALDLRGDQLSEKMKELTEK